MEDFIEIVIIPLVVGLTLFTTFVFVPLYFVDKAGCEDYAKLLGFEYKHSFSNGCVIKTEKGWINSKRYIINKEEK